MSFFRSARHAADATSVASIISALITCVSSVARAGDIAPGNPDYPVTNPSPQRNIAVSGRVPEQWDLHIVADYYPKNGGIYDPATGGLKCGRTVGLGASVPWHVTYELAVVRHGDTFSTTIPLDRFQEGRCGWHVLDVSYNVTKRKGDPPASGRLALAPQDVVATYPPIDLTDPRTQVDLWCWDSPLAQQFWRNGARLDCELAGNAGISSMKYIPVAKRGDNRAVYIKPSTRELSFVFHDLDAEAVIERGKTDKGARQ